MPLFSLSPNIQETEAASRKRLDDAYSGGSEVAISISVNEDFSHSENIAGLKPLDMSAPAPAPAPDCSSRKFDTAPPCGHPVCQYILHSLLT